MTVRKLPSFNVGDRVAIVWDDAFELSGGYWRTMDAIYETHHEQSCGYFMQATERFITIAQTLGQGTDDEEISYGGVFSIPVGFIISIDPI